MSAMKTISAAVQTVVAELLPQLHAQAECDRLGLECDQFAAILCEVAAKHLEGNASHEETRSFLATIRIGELALARACAAGSNPAWDIFLTRYREKLYQSALRLAREDSAARDLADSLYAELYGTNLRAGARVSKLSSFTGRGSLEGWLRTVLAQEFVNRYRRTKRLVSLEEENEGGEQIAAATPEPLTSADSRLEMATDQALSELPAEDRFVLAAYYLDGRTLAEIARILGVHESTISRKVDKLAKGLRKKIVSRMVQQGMARRQAEEALEVDVRDLQINIRRSLAQESSAGAFSEQKDEMRFEPKVARRAKS